MDSRDHNSCEYQYADKAQDGWNCEKGHCDYLGIACVLRSSSPFTKRRIRGLQNHPDTHVAYFNPRLTPSAAGQKVIYADS
jgi:hypothetical protein